MKLAFLNNKYYNFIQKAEIWASDICNRCPCWLHSSADNRAHVTGLMIKIMKVDRNRQQAGWRAWEPVARKIT